ncbi:hypothetical protein [Paraliomyxa miuraensis]|uniref:hypothetical protein n=1 Tax=Paraliomyxa miuraensis TaxID=376150 RepID=UPI00224F347E|nr:hypothetical protein [Paraliomyxa miuraensis]MCX4247813.1 hypothetical protein [Paraliomyxa miuraensis]
MPSPLELLDEVVLENRPYGPDSTEDEQRAIRAQVVRISDDVVLYRETPVVTAFSLDLMFGRIGELTAGRSPFYLVIDLTVTGPPSAEVRQYLRGLFRALEPAYVAVFTGKNFMLNVAAKFVLGKVFGGVRHSVHKTLDEALQAVASART